MKKVSGLSTSASVEGATNLEGGKASKNALSGIVRSCVMAVDGTWWN